MGKPIVEYRKSELYERAVDEYGVFNAGYDFLVFLAILGYHEDEVDRDDYRGSRDDGTKGEIALQNLYSNELYRVLMSSLAFQDTNDPSALADSRKQMEVLAQYGSGGLRVAESEFGSTAGDPTDAIVNYIQDHRDDSEDFQGELGKIVEAFDDEMMEMDQ